MSGLRGFSDRDSQNLVSLLNFINDHATFTLNNKQTIEWFGLLSWAQKDLHPKIQSHLLEIGKVKEVAPPPPEPAPEKPKKKKKK